MHYIIVYTLTFTIFKALSLSNDYEYSFWSLHYVKKMVRFVMVKYSVNGWSLQRTDFWIHLHTDNFGKSCVNYKYLIWIIYISITSLRKCWCSICSNIFTIVTCFLNIAFWVNVSSPTNRYVMVWLSGKSSFIEIDKLSFTREQS